MYSLYREECSSKSLEPVSEWVYRKFSTKNSTCPLAGVLPLHMHTLTHAHMRIPTLCLSHTHTTHTITTHTCTPPLFLSLSHSHTRTHTYSLYTHSLFSPRTETCKGCEFKIQIDAERDSNTHQQLTLQWDLHKIHAESAYQSLREDTALTKSSGDTEMFTFDLQQALVTPTLTTNVVFCKRQL